MSDYEFRIGAYSPKTIPMVRLTQYMATLADLLGECDRVHFEALKEGSTVLAVSVQPEAQIRTKRRLLEARTADETHPAFKPLQRMNQLLREDNADGSMLSGGAEIIQFPGRRKAMPEIVGPFNKHTEIDGVLVRIGGRDKTAHAQIEDAEGRAWRCEVDRDMARCLAPHLFGGPLRLSGMGRWQRTEQAQWKLVRFKVESFNALRMNSLADSVAAVRKLALDLTAMGRRTETW